MGFASFCLPKMVPEKGFVSDLCGGVFRYIYTEKKEETFKQIRLGFRKF